MPSAINFFKTLWGVEAPLETLDLNQFAGVEACLIYLPQESRDYLKTASVSGSLKLILLLQTSGDGVDEHLKSLDNQITEALTYQPEKINIHGGLDRWTMEESKRYFSGFLELEKKYSAFGVPLLHETHRGRILYAPWIALKILQEFPNLLLTADLSHWVVVSERHLTQEFQDVLDIVKRNTRHIHARPASPQSIQLQGAQLQDTKYYEDIEMFKNYWTQIIQTQSDMGYGPPSIDPEFGPWPYNTAQSDPESDITFIVNLIREIERNLIK